MKWLFAFALLLLAGCILDAPEEQTLSEPPPPPDYSYDLFVKDIYSIPEYPRLTEAYTIRTTVQIYGRYTPSAYSIWILDGNKTLLQENITDPALFQYFEFEYYAENTQPHNMRVEVQSLDPAHPEPEQNLENNMMRKDIKAYPIGFYDIYNWEYNWFYDAVGMQVKQAQAFTLQKPLNVSKIEVYVQARVPPSPDSKLLISLHEKPTSWGNIGIGDRITVGELDATEISSTASWHQVEFEPVELSNTTYWIVLEFESLSSAGVEWYRAEGNKFGEVYDTQMLDVAGYGEWEYKGFDFAFKLE